MLFDTGFEAGLLYYSTSWRKYKMKKFDLCAVLLVAAALAFFPTGCSESGSDSAAGETVYTGIGRGCNGPIAVSITLDEAGAVMDVRIDSHTETPSSFVKVVPVIPNRIIAAGSPDGVDIVSGATMSSRGILHAVKDALAKALPPATGTPEKIEYQLISDETGIKYYSLSTGKEVDPSKKNTSQWDIAMENHSSSMLYIYTNSGASASEFESGGDGGVWFTGNPDFETVTFSDRITDFSSGNSVYEDYTQDTIRYVIGGMGAATSAVRMNIMSFFGFAGGTGLEGSPFATSGMDVYEFDKKAAYCKRTDVNSMPPQYRPTNQVYIIKHGNGQGYSKLQIYTLVFGRSQYMVDFKFKTLSGTP